MVRRIAFLVQLVNLLLDGLLSANKEVKHNPSLLEQVRNEVLEKRQEVLAICVGPLAFVNESILIGKM